MGGEGVDEVVGGGISIVVLANSPIYVCIHMCTYIVGHHRGNGWEATHGILRSTLPSLPRYAVIMPPVMHAGVSPALARALAVVVDCHAGDDDLQALKVTSPAGTRKGGGGRLWLPGRGRGIDDLVR